MLEKLQENVLLSPRVSFRIGGKAKYFIEVDSTSDVLEALDFAHRKNVPIFVLGSGTNILIDDNGFDGVVLKIRDSKLGIQNPIVEVGAGELMSTLVDSGAEKGLAGLEWAGGLPGTLGGAIRGNAGCFGGEIKDVVEFFSNHDPLISKFFSAHLPIVF